MKKTKICTRCQKDRPIKYFYICGGIRRGECKDCTISKNIQYQREKKTWLNRTEYMKDYRAKNKAKFEGYSEKSKIAILFKKELKKKVPTPYTSTPNE